jgi:hypothetical protein
MKAEANNLLKIEELERRVAELEEALLLILPLAKGYAAEHNVGRNREMVIDAENALTPPKR